MSACSPPRCFCHGIGNLLFSCPPIAAEQRLPNLQWEALNFESPAIDKFDEDKLNKVYEYILDLKLAHISTD